MTVKNLNDERMVGNTLIFAIYRLKNAALLNDFCFEE